MLCGQGENLATIYDRLSIPATKKEIEKDTYEYIVESGNDSKKLQDALNRGGREGFMLAWMKMIGLPGTDYIVVFERKKREL